MWSDKAAWLNYDLTNGGCEAQVPRELGNFAGEPKRLECQNRISRFENNAPPNAII
jgi:hypothetical protein